jgi:16S rRNA (cytidine1402-2'-O)-methyltransferase
MESGYATVIYESPFRVVKLLADIAEIDGERQVVVGRELTKLHEELATGTATAVHEDFASRERILGEFSVYISGKKRSISEDE